MGNRRKGWFLLVDDDPGVVKAASRLLADWFEEIVVATTVREGVAAIDGRPAPEAAIIDGKLACGGNGAAVARHLGRRHPQVMALAWTGHREDRELADAAQEQGYEYGLKPVGVVPFARRVVVRRHVRRSVLIRRTAAVAAEGDLTLRETEILAFAVAEKSYEEMGRRLGISVDGVRDHAKQIGRKCGDSLGTLAWRIRVGEDLSLQP